MTKKTENSEPIPNAPSTPEVIENLQDPSSRLSSPSAEPLAEHQEVENLPPVRGPAPSVGDKISLPDGTEAEVTAVKADTVTRSSGAVFVYLDLLLANGTGQHGHAWRVS